jgi:hypothetical protein
MLVKDSSNPDFAETQIAQLDTIAFFAESATKSPDVFIVGISNDHDVESLFAANARKLLAQSEIIVLCDFEDADKWQQYVLRQEISDCFITRVRSKKSQPNSLYPLNKEHICFSAGNLGLLISCV